ncbi:MAG: hypothetical protein PHQ32_03360 [Firmicutes bacterium]|nr:hypothetical protein [Bacillota bacterium]
MKLQPNEKRLITILAFVAIIALSFQYLIYPEILKGQELAKQNTSLNKAYNLLINKDGIATQLQTDYDVEYSKLNTLLDKSLSSSLKDEDLDRYFTEMVIKHGLKPSSLTIEPIEEGSKEYSTITQVYVTLGVDGSLDQLVELMADIGNKQFLKLVNMDTTQKGEEYNHTLKIELIMLKG